MPLGVPIVMQYVLLAEHAAEICPTSNGKMREVLKKSGGEVPGVAKKHGVKILAGPFVSEQWNKVRIIPVQTLEAGMKELDHMPPLF